MGIKDIETRTPLQVVMQEMTIVKGEYTNPRGNYVEVKDVEEYIGKIGE